MAATEAAVEAYADYWRRFSAATVGEILQLGAPDMRFVDPFNDVSGVERVRRVLADAFDRADEVRVEVLHTAARGEVAYYRWRFHLVPRGGGRPWRFDGVSEVRFAADGRVAEHVDHWDAGSQFYARIAFVGWLIRQIRRRLRVEA